jgi:hypothetical protein
MKGSKTKSSSAVKDWLASRNADLTAKFTKILDASHKIAETQHTGQDTGAGSLHYDAVYDNLNRLVPALKLQNWRPVEAFVMLCAVYLHDIGKSRPSETGKHHALVGKEIVIEQAEKLGLNQSEARVIGDVIHAHGPIDLNTLQEERGIAPFGEVRVRYLGAILQLADDLDTDFLRADSLVRAVIPESGVKSAGFCEKWPKTGVFIKRFVQQSMDFQSIAVTRPTV